MSNMDQKSSTTKLRGTEKLKHRSQYQSYTSFDNRQNDFSNEQAKLISDLNLPKCGSRGMAIKQVTESITTINTCLKTSNLNYSNSSIEQHFKKLREENEKKIKNEYEKLWENMVNSHEKN